MSTPRVSVCVPVCDGAAHLSEALASVRTQSFDRFELLVIDDASSDGSAELAANLGDPRLRLLRNPSRLGLPGNWNRCLAEARGSFVKFLFQDDLLAPRALEALLLALEAHPEAPLAFGRREIRYEGTDQRPLEAPAYTAALAGFLASFRRASSGLDLVVRALAEGRSLTVNVVGEPSFVLLRREASLAAGGFDARFRQLADWELWLRLGLRGPLVLVDEPLGMFRVHPGSRSGALEARPLARENAALLGRVLELYGALLPPGARFRLRRERMAWWLRGLLGRRAVGGARGTRPRRSVV